MSLTGSASRHLHVAPDLGGDRFAITLNIVPTRKMSSFTILSRRSGRGPRAAHTRARGPGGPCPCARSCAPVVCVVSSVLPPIIALAARVVGAF